MNARPVYSFMHDLAGRLIQSCDDPVERKNRIMIAREHGLLTDQEAADWIAILEVKAA